MAKFNGNDAFMRILIFILCFNNVFCLFDPISIGIMTGIGSALYNYDTIKRHTYCKFVECCNENYIPGDWNGLKTQLENRLFGQHLVIESLVPALKSHYQQADSSKPLVISFHGTVGTGKTYTADMLAEKMYKLGYKSRFVNKFVRGDFPSQHESALDGYRDTITRKIEAALWICDKSLFIFEEVEKMPQRLFDQLTSYMDHHRFVRGVKINNAVFIFISNTAGLEVANHLGKLFKTGKLREEIELREFEKLLEMGAYNLKGGLKSTKIIEARLIDHFIPFLPLEKKHVEQCIRNSFRRHSIYPTDEQVRQIADNEIVFDNSGIFATGGCKRIDKKVDVQVFRSHYL